ncbi:MAG: hypothetical protein IJ438_03270 [Clostridia bacterium]|nr:hypothetical protein [Clostridia bacterium]
MLEDFQHLARNCAALQQEVAAHANKATLHQHISDTLRRCLPAAAVTPDLVEGCLLAVQSLPTAADPMHTGAIYAYAGQYLLASHSEDEPLLQRLHDSAKRLLWEDRPANRDDLRLVTLDALYRPGILPRGMHNAYMRYRLGLNGPRLSCEEIACRMHKPLIFIHETEAALLNILSTNHAGGPYA